MSENFLPGPGVEPQVPYATIFLSQRDLGIRIPINYVTTAGVSLTAACFSKHRFEDDDSADCFSNLLASGYRRLEIDLYWDEGRRVWSFCPVQLPNSIPDVMPASTTTLGHSSNSVTATNSFTQFTARTISSLSKTRASVQGSNNTQTLSFPTAGTSLGQTLPSISAFPNTSNEPLVSIGPFVCTTTINLSTLTSQLLDYIQKTQTTVNANVLYVIINLHAAASPPAPESPAPRPSLLPNSSNTIGALFQANFSTYIYTPNNLRIDRANLNSSWYQVTEAYRPVSEYYTTAVSDYDIVSTEDGWPSESYIELSKSKRLLLAWGDVDPQLSGYNFTTDDGVIFPSNYIQDIKTNLSATDSGTLTGGCVQRDSYDTVSQVNSSWAVAPQLPGFSYPLSPTSNLTPLLNLTSAETNCGISPMLNATLLNATARENYILYQNFSYATIWSWAPGEPKTYNGLDDESLHRCATANIDLLGRWVVADCSQKYFAACRARGQPYNWTITTYQISYSYADQACPKGFYFAAPRTALENSYLNRVMKDIHRDYNGHGAWVDFNSLDVKTCWTTGGPNATCPYSATLAQKDDLRRRVILVPTIAAFIVLVITALNIFAKAAGNRKTNRRRRKRANNGFIYDEGVPS